MVQQKVGAINTPQDITTFSPDIEAGRTYKLCWCWVRIYPLGLMELCRWPGHCLSAAKQFDTAVQVPAHSQQRALAQHGKKDFAPSPRVDSFGLPNASAAAAGGAAASPAIGAAAMAARSANAPLAAR